MLLEYWSALKERWRVAVGALLAVVAAILGVAAVLPPQYAASTSLYISSQSSADNPTGAYQGGLLSEQRVKSYTLLVTSPRVLAPAAAQVGFPGGASGLAPHVEATAATDTIVLNITATTTDPAQSVAVIGAVGPIFANLVSELERPLDPARPAAVVARVVQTDTDAIKVSPNWPITIMLALVVGLLVGAAAAILRQRSDTTLRTPAALSAAADAPNLGVVLYRDDANGKPIVVDGLSQDPAAEAFRQIRTNLQFVDVAQKSKVIVFSSAYPGEGKSTSVSNIALAAAYAGNRVALIEADLRKPRLSGIFGIEGAVGLTSCLIGRVTLTEARQRWQARIDLLSSGPIPPNPSELLGSVQMAELIAELRSHYDLVLLDAPPLLPVTDAAVLASVADGVVLLGRYGSTGSGQVKMAADSVRAVGANVLGTILTCMPGRVARQYGGYGGYSYTSASAEPLQMSDFDATDKVSSRALMAEAGKPAPRPRPNR